jgi:maleylpyruvate isomerase
VPIPTEIIEGCRVSQSALEQSLVGLTDETVGQESRLPNWTVGHVLTHLARNADSVVRRLEGAKVGQIINQYPGGFEGRAADIELGAGRSAQMIAADVVATNAQVLRVCATLDDAAWDAPSRDVAGVMKPSRDVLFSRWREIEVHRCDLGLGYQPADWPPLMVALWLPAELATLQTRSDPNALLAWVIGRGAAPDVSPW